MIFYNNLDLLDFNYAFALSRQCLRILGVWPDPHAPLSDFRRSNIRFVIVVCIMCLFMIIPQITNMIHTWGNITRMVEYIGSVNYSLMGLCKLIVTWYHGETLWTLMTSVLTDWVNSKKKWERNTMLKIAGCGRSLSFRCYAFSTLTVSLYLCFNLLKFYRNMQHSQRSLVYHFVYPYKIQKSSNYAITYFAQISSGIYSVFINCTVDSFVSILVLHLCAQLINLRTTLNNLINELANKSISSLRFTKSLSAITIRHEHLIRNAKTIDDCYSIVLFVHMLAATFQLCFQTFQVYTIITDHLNVSFIKIIFLSLAVILVLTHVYIYCYSAERLLTESTSIAYGVYECKWYDLPSKNVKDLMFIVYRSMIPLKVTAGKFGIFSMEMFGIMIKTSIGYLSALLTIRN